MSSIPRRLRKLNLSDLDAEEVQPDDEGLQGPPEIDNILPEMPHESNSPIKIIWPNGAIREIVGVFRKKYLSQLKGGKIIVETDENGVPNERSASVIGNYLTDLAKNSTLAPLHIPRWDHEMFEPFQEKMIKHVEVKFVYPAGTKQLTRDWILMTLAKRLRAYKSSLKAKYYNRNTRSLEEILKDVPPGVNENQWQTIVGTWCQESHAKLSHLNSERAKQQKNSHTTGRKGHARLLKEMETEKKRKVSKIELWDQAHKRKDDNHVTANVNTTTDTTHGDLAKRQLDNNGNVPSQDCSEVSKSVPAKRIKLRGFYHDKYWSHVKVSQGLTFVERPEQVQNVQFALRAVGDNVEDLKDELQMMRAFMAKKFPGEDYRNITVDAENDEVDLPGRVDDKDIQHETDNDREESSRNMPTSLNILQQMDPRKCGKTMDGYINSSLPHEHMIAKKAQTEICGKENLGSARSGVAREQVTNQQMHPENCSKLNYSDSSLGRGHIIAKKASTENFTKTNQDCAGSSLPHKQLANQDKAEVYLFSANPRNKKKVVAKGTAVSHDKTYVVGGNMLGDQYYGVRVDLVTELAGEKLLRPYENIQTVRDAIGRVIAWPRCLVKRRVRTSSNQPPKNLVYKGNENGL